MNVKLLANNFTKMEHMKKFTKLKWLLFTLVTVFVLGTTALSTVAYFKLRDVKASLQEVLQGYIDGKIVIANAKVNFFPSAIELEGVELFAPKAKKPAASIPKAKLSFDLLPLLQKKLKTSLKIVEPQVHLHQAKAGPSNMERIFAPVLKEEKDSKTSLDEFWWKRLAIEKLSIENAHFISSQEGKKEKTEIKQINIQADDIRFDSPNQPANIEISYKMPDLAKGPLILKTLMFFKEKESLLSLEEGRVLWGPLKLALGGQVRLPGEKNKEVVLDFSFAGKGLRLKEIQEFFYQETAVEGPLNIKGSITGSPYAPIILMELSSAELKAKEVTIKDFFARLKKIKEPIELIQLSLKVFEGQVQGKGQLKSASKTSGTLNLKLDHLSVAAMSGKSKKEMPARLNGQLKLQSSDVSNMAKLSGGGPITVGPIPLPQVSLKNKIKLAQIVTAGSGFEKMVHLKLLEDSRQVIGSEVNPLKAKVVINGNKLSLVPYSLANGHFRAGGKADIFEQKTISSMGTFTLNRRVTQSLILDPHLRRILTQGRQELVFPFTLKGPLADPEVTVDSSHLQKGMALATADLLRRQALGGLKPEEMAKEALKNTPVKEVKDSLNKVLNQPNQQRPTTRRRPSSSQKTQPTKKPSTGNKAVDQLLFGK